VPSQAGRIAVVTGSNTGIGFEAARVLAARGATVVLACRDTTKAEAAAERILSASPQAKVRAAHLDLASLASVRAAANALNAAYEGIDLLVNNAGLMFAPYSQTEDSFEQQFGVNHLGHFALTGLLLGHLLKAPGSRVVTVSSYSHRQGAIDFADLGLERGYRRGAAYARSKLANLLFSYELQRRLAAAGAATTALAAHPGFARTGLPGYMSLMARLGTRLIEPVLAQSAAMAALPVLRAATDPRARGGEFYGPGGRIGTKGYPVPVSSSARSHDAALQRRLWTESERLTGVTYPV
jgi:NAD(P)-dependent dehydrogenase (short-subunit alcohol dehydrogenase family)